MLEPPIEFHLPTVTSTNDYARELLTVNRYVFVSAMHQTSGRGRSGRVWTGDYGVNCYCSMGMVHDANLSTSEIAAYMARGALAAISTLRKFGGSNVFRLKFPNDVQAQTPEGWAKIAGILVEHEFQGSRCNSSVIGIGINVSQKIFPETIMQPCTSLALLGCDIPLKDIISHLKNELHELNSMSADETMKLWIHELNILGRHIRILGDPSSWIVTKVMNDGRLVARNEVSQLERTVTDGDTVRYQD